MRKDINFKPVEDVYLTITKEKEQGMWKVYLLNRNKKKITHVMITSKGYGVKNGEKQETSILRHAIPHVESGEFALIEPIDPGVFHLNNEYWVSFFIENQVYDKKYIFVPDSIKDENLSYIKELNQNGILHT